MNYDKLLEIIAELKLAIYKADRLNADLCQNRQTWTMSIPVLQTDSDIIFGNLSRQAELLIKAIEEMKENENA